ncbi:hypothetical protein [Fontivita pretiosa]|uniref:hypothetical protein n=1 Tax=Fontivita pretiosa TaxID=2989684 RepID=UPI003D1847EA
MSSTDSPPTTADPLQAFAWTRQPDAERLLRQIVQDFVSRCPVAAELSRRMKEQTGTRFHDWIGHITLSPDDPRVVQIEDVGYIVDAIPEELTVYRHPGGMFPAVVVHDLDRTGNGSTTEIAVKVDSVADFLAANGIETAIQGEPLSDVRVATICRCNGTMLSVIERHGSRSFDRPGQAPPNAIRRLFHLERFRMRRRDFDDEIEGFAHTNQLIDDAIRDLGVDLTCDLFFAAEREYWMRRNRAAQVQYARQQKLGLGWANHDHHTYRSSRQHFARLIATWEKLGFQCRERFYAGREAGWGAQVMEQPVTGIVTFNDVDLSPDELMGDFSHEGLPPRDQLGTVGLWCALHGEAFLQAGMHHLECQFDFDALARQLEAEAGIRTMKPFTDFSYLRQAFTEGQRWPVSEKRLRAALAKGYITPEQAEQFRANGAIGSHLENLERNEGFKGFNQTGVSEIIAATDPRKHVQAVAHGA